MKSSRILYIDFIKVLAMFIVTIGHCAQSLSLQIFPDKVIPSDFFVTIHMPLFMIASGYVLNFEKMRQIPLNAYVYNKFKRLIIPLFFWLIIYSLFTIRILSVSEIFNIYWYLFALFLSLIVLRLFSSFIKNDIVLLVLSLLFVLIVPLFKISHTNFMFPFLIYGYLLKRYIDKINVAYAILLGGAFLIIYATIWNVSHTVYLSPLNMLAIDCGMIKSFLIRLVIGVVGSTCLYLIICRLQSKHFIKQISKYGRYTLIFYTMTTVINGFTSRLFSYLNFSIQNPILLETLSIVFAFVQMYLIYKFAKRFENNKRFKLLLGI